MAEHRDCVAAPGCGGARCLAEERMAPIDLQAALPLWRAHLHAVNRSPRTIASYDKYVRRFLQTLPDPPTHEHITLARIEAYQAQLARRLSPASVGLMLTGVRSFVRWCLRTGHRTDDPTLLIEYPQLPDDLPGRGLDGAQLRELCAALRIEPEHRAARFQHRRNRLCCSLMIYAGLRLSECAALRWDAVRHGKHGLTVVVRGGKGGRDRAIPAHPALERELQRAENEKHRKAAYVLTRTDGAGMEVDGLEKIFGRWMKRLELSFEFSAHQLRHSFCTELIDSGATLFDVQAAMGHKDPKTTRRYYRLNPEHLRGDIGRLPEW
jgi:site-specific recombinase XerD